jgi:uncharacterized protein with PIN domain
LDGKTASVNGYGCQTGSVNGDAVANMNIAQPTFGAANRHPARLSLGDFPDGGD